jgi:transposase
LLQGIDYSLFDRESPNPSMGRPCSVDAYTMMVVIVYGRTQGKYSCRSLESLCRRDLFLHAVLEGRPAPDHVTINRFIKGHPESIMGFFDATVDRLSDLGELRKDIVFQDGTKIESRAGKYSFVWKTGVEKNLGKLREKAVALVCGMSLHYGWGIACDEWDDPENKLRIARAKLGPAPPPGLLPPRGKGHPLPPGVKFRELADRYLEKFAEYRRSLSLIGPDRKSMSRTDRDATFMRMKEDHMRNGQLKPAYNIQTLVDGNYMVGCYSSNDRTDYGTMVPALDRLNQSHAWKYSGYCADSGYDSLQNRLALEQRGIKDYIKPQNYEISKKRSYGNDIGRKGNMAYDEKRDCYICANGKRLPFTREKKTRNRNGARGTIKVYRCTKGCLSCPLRKGCIKKGGGKYKTLDVNVEFDRLREVALANITGGFGTEVRVNRSIQAEGSFAQIKANWSFRRFLSFGKTRTTSEWVLMGIAINAVHLGHRIEESVVGNPFWYEIPPEQEKAG